MAKQSPQAVYGSNGWEIDLARRELRSRGTSVPIGSRAFEILEVLVQSAGELVDKYDLIGRVWPGAIVEENTLQFHISAIRKALGADRSLLKTVSGRGYRLLGDWTARHAIEPGRRAGLPEREPGQPFRTNVPLAGSALIGRGASTRHLLEMLSAYRVVTLTGPGGIGKSVLALEVARKLFPTLEGNCWLVELAALSDPALVPSAVASALGLRMSGRDISAESVARVIGAERLLLILDNCEHLADAAAALAEAVVRMCPNVLVLATSQEILRIDGECVYRVPPLDVPPSGREEAVDIDTYSAVQFFIARLSALDSSFSVSPESLPLVAAICRQLDGMPLGIEFAAARVATLGLQQVADGLIDRFSLLTAGRRTALPRHQTLRATLDWSYDFLRYSEQTLLRRLGIFVGGFTLEAATAVMSDTGADVSVVADGIASLAVKSLVSLDSSVPSGRWRLLETTRAYALDKLAENGEAEHVARRHAEYFQNFFTSMGGPLVALDDMPRYAREIDNLRAALEWAFSRDGKNAGVGVGLAAAAVPIFPAMSLLPECYRWSERALLALDDGWRGTATEMRLQSGLGYALMYTRGGGDVAREALERSFAISEDCSDLLYQMWLLAALNIFHFRNGNFRTALQYAKRSCAVAAKTNDPVDAALAHFFLGNTLYVVGDLAGARTELEAVLQQRSHTQNAGKAYFTFDVFIPAGLSLANTLCLQGYPEQAVVQAHKILEDARHVEHSVTLSIALRHAVLLFLWIGDLETSERLIDWYVSNAQSHSLGPQIVAGRALKAELAIRRGEEQSGVEILQASLQELNAAHYMIMTSTFNISLAEGLAATGRFAEGVKVADDGVRQVEENGDVIYLPELLRVKGKILFSMPKPPLDEAQENFVKSIELSRRQGARACELRTAIDLAKLIAARGRPEDARAVLEPVFASFEKGFDTVDLSSAERLLATLP